jgi:trans-aconitate methyltransferase
MAYEFDGEKYKKASKHQKGWGAKLLSDLPIAQDSRILDLGCGDGVLTRKLAAMAPKGKTIGLDGSRGMIAAARAAAPMDNLTFILADINDLDFNEEFDLIYSNAALHWILDHERLVKRCFKALKTGGVIGWNFGGEGNCANLIAAVRETIVSPRYGDLFKGFAWPWRMPSAEEYIALLSGAGYKNIEVYIENADHIFDDEKAMIDWIDEPCIVPFLAFIKDAADRSDFRQSVIETMKSKARDKNGSYIEIFRRINISARK